MPGLVWYAGDPDECAGKRERAAWDRCVGFEVNATGAARPGKGCVVVPGSNNKAALPNQKPFDRWPCRNHAKKLFKAIEKYACANPLPFDAAGCQALSGEEQKARVRERIAAAIRAGAIALAAPAPAAAAPTAAGGSYIGGAAPAGAAPPPDFPPPRASTVAVVAHAQPAGADGATTAVLAANLTAVQQQLQQVQQQLQQLQQQQQQQPTCGWLTRPAARTA